MAARADLLKAAEAMALKAAEGTDESLKPEEITAYATAAKIALEAVALTESLPDDGHETIDRLVEQLEDVGQAYSALRGAMRHIADRFSGAGTPVATRNAELIQQAIEESDGMLPQVARS